MGIGAGVGRKGTSRWVTLRSAAVRGREAVILLLNREHKAAVQLLLENEFDVMAENFDKAKALR